MVNNVSTSTSTKDKSLIILILIGVCTFVLWQFSIGRIFLYPFALLGTWFHEMGHGLTAIILGGSFIRLEINPDGSGLAVHTVGTFLGRVSNSIIAGAGPVGPTIAGSIFVMTSGNKNLARIMMLLLGAMLIISDIIWIRTFFGFALILAFGIVVLLIAIKGNDKVQRITMQFLGIQAFLSLYLSIGYLFSSGGTVSGTTFSSDTQVISQSLFLPHWFWAGAILLFSLIIIVFTLLVAYRKK